MKTGISYHWTGGGYIPDWLDLESYHGGIIWDGRKALSEKWNDYSSNEPQHTWNRNTSLIGIAACGMGGQITSTYWEKPIRIEQIEELCLFGAEVAFIKKITISNIRTHAEWALLDDYGPLSGDPQTKWDLSLFSPGRATPTSAIEHGKILRGKTSWYLKEIQNNKRKVRAFQFESKRNGEKL